MNTGQDFDGITGIHRDDERSGEVQAEVRLPAADQLRLDPTGFRHDVADLGKAFRAQQLLGDILGRDADAPDLCKADASRFGRWLRGKRLLDPNEARGAGCRKAGQEATAILNDLHRKRSFRTANTLAAGTEQKRFRQRQMVS